MEKKFQRRVSGARKEGWFEVLSRVERKSLLRSWHLGRMAWGKCVQMSVRKADACREACTPWWQQVQRCWVREAGGEGEGPVIREKGLQPLCSDGKSRRLSRWPVGPYIPRGSLWLLCCMWTRVWETFCCKRPVNKYFRLCGAWSSVYTAQLCPWSTEVAMDSVSCFSVTYKMRDGPSESFLGVVY